MRDLFDLTGKTAVIVGGTSTLGSTMAVGLAEYGAKIALIARRPEKAAEVEERIKEVDGEVKFFQGDTTDHQSLEKAADGVINWSGSIDVLINAPGKNSATPFFEITMEEWDSIMDVNLKGLVISCQVFAKRMIDIGKGGSIINISSASSNPPLSKVFTYSASKAGVNNVTQFLARELAPNNIRVNALIPGFFPAEQNKKILSQERIDTILNHTPMNRFGEPEELIGVTIWLSSEKASSFVTGSLVRIDGGFGAMTI